MYGIIIRVETAGGAGLYCVLNDLRELISVKCETSNRSLDNEICIVVSDVCCFKRGRGKRSRVHRKWWGS